MELRLLGPVEWWTGGDQVRVGPPKQRAVLAALAYSVGLPVPVGVLIERVWGDSPPAEARTSLQSYIARLRQTLRRAGDADGAVRLERAGDGYLLAAPVTVVDVHRARDLSRQARAGVEAADHDEAARLSRAALDLWRGEPLAGIAGDWADRVRAGLTGERQTLLVVNAQAQLARGRPHDVVQTLVEAVAEHPDAEQLTTLLMVALYRCGRAAEALDAYRRLSRHLVAHLGVEPGPEARRLHRAILSPDPDPGLSGGSPPAIAPPSAPTGPPPGPAGSPDRPADPVRHIDRLVDQMHTLIRGYARQQARQEETTEEFRAQLRRSLEHCLSAAAQATRLLSPGAATRPAAPDLTVPRRASWRTHARRHRRGSPPTAG